MSICSNLVFVNVTYQVAHKAQVGHGEERNEDVEQHAVQRRHVDHHKVRVDGTNQQNDSAAGNLPHPGGKQSCVNAGGRNTGITAMAANLL